MERINLSVLSGVSHEGMLQLKSYVDMTGSDPQHQSYDYECLFPETCNPREICLSFIKTAGGYTFRVNPHFRYDGNNSVMGILADTGAVSFSSWQEVEQALRTFTDEWREPLIVDPGPAPESLTNWEEIQMPKSTSNTVPTFEEIYHDLSLKVMGQDEAIETVAYQVAHFLQKRNPKKPLSILMSGTPGTGKSETAKVVADILAHKCTPAYSTVWTDLNNFTESHTVARLVGAPPGYVGYEDEPVFEAVNHNPYTIFHFDELDKAHKTVLKIFLSVLEDGKSISKNANSNGSREYDFKHCIFFFTSNYDLTGTKNTKRKIGFSLSDSVENVEFKDDAVNVAYSESQQVVDEPLAKRIYRETEQARHQFVEAGNLREIASRFQSFVQFKPLSEEAKVKILAKQILETGFEYGVRLSYIAPGIMQEMIREATSENSLTVRSFRGIIEGYLAPAFAGADENPNASYRLEGTLAEPHMIDENREQ